MNIIPSLLKSELIRHRVIPTVKSRYFHELDLAIDIGSNLKAPIPFPTAANSFSEIFVQNAYTNIHSFIPWPRHWLDIGCHCGYFSLWLYLQQARQGTLDQCSAVLVDADSRAASAIATLQKLNTLPTSQCRFIGGAIAAESNPLFKQRQGMGSALGQLSDARYQDMYAVPRITEDALLSVTPEKLDLLKLDVEGAELIFLKHYPRVAQRARHLLLEWHSWAPDWSGLEGLDLLCRDLGFQRTAIIDEAHQHVVNNRPASCGTLLYSAPAT
jgi:FkbM family methyltransferase